MSELHELTPGEHRLLEAVALNLPLEVPVTDENIEVWLEALDREVETWSLTWKDAAIIAAGSAMTIALIFSAWMTITTAAIAAVGGVFYGTLLRSMTRAIPAT